MLQPGLTPNTSIGGHGRYAAFTTDCFHAFPFGIFRDHSLYTGEPSPRLLYAIDRPLVYLSRQHGHSWTGLTQAYEGSETGDDPVLFLTAHLRSTLPAPLLIPQGEAAHRLRLHFPGPTVPRRSRSLTSDAVWGPDDTSLEGEDRAFLIGTHSTPFLFLSSSGVRRVHTICGRHVEWTFADPSPHVMLVPIRDQTDIDMIAPRLTQWLALIERPPVEISEQFEEPAGAHCLRVMQSALGLDGQEPAFSPVPPFFGLLEETEPGTHPLVQIETAAVHRLLSTPLGPYFVAEGNRVVLAIETGWMQARMEPTTCIPEGTDLAPVPEELTYAGDWTWDPRSPLDQLLSCRTWGHLLPAVPEPRRSELLAILDVPTPEAFRASLMRVTEPLSGLTWAKDDYLFHQKGKYIAFDTDWYNGLSLSGIQRATVCGEPALEEKARTLASTCRKEREEMVAYFSIFHDWQISIASMETHFPFLNTDCAHNGMEGLLAEARLRESEGSPEGAAFCRYLAAKSAVALLAAIQLPRWVEHRIPGFIKQPKPGDHWTSSQPDPRLFGSISVSPHDGILPVTPATKNPYQFAGHFPPYSALLRRHGPLGQFQEITEIWEKEFPRRHSDWIEHYTGANWRERFARDHDQEARIQAPVFYALAPEVCLRLWLLDQAPADIEALFHPQPINLAEQILLRADFKLR